MSCYPLQVVSRMVMNRSGEVFYIGGADILPTPLNAREEAEAISGIGTEREEEVKKKLIILDREPMEQLEERLRRRGSPGIVIIDSFQYSGLNYKTYKEFKERHPKKLFIFISHAEGLHPAGRSARKVEYDADVKIMVSCFKAWCKSRFMERPGEPYVIWEEGAAKTLKDDNMEDYLNDGMGE